MWIGGCYYVVYLCGVLGGKSWVLGNVGFGVVVGSWSVLLFVFGGK